MRGLRRTTRSTRVAGDRPSHRRKARSGAALIETLIAATVLTVGVLNAVMASLKCSDLQQSTAQYAQAHHTSRDLIEQIRGGDLAIQHQAFSDDPDRVIGGQQVAIRFPNDLLVDFYGGVVPATARFRDLDADGEVDLDGTATDGVSLLPIRITVSQGNLRFQLESLLTEN